MDPSRRRTLASSGISQIPTSVSRPTAASRQSLAPTSSNNNRQSLAPARSLGASRQSLAPSGSQELGGSQGSQLFSQGHGGPVREAPMTGGRSNMYSSMGSASVGRSGVLKSSHVDAPYAPPSERRTSHYRRSTTTGGGTTPISALQPPTLQRPRADPRESRPIENRRRYAADIVAFLTSHRYNGPADTKILMTPTGAQFQTIFKFLIGNVDPNYEFRGKKFEDEVGPALKMAQYPFADSITKSHLQAVGSQQSWPNMLAMLHWLVVMVENREEAFHNCQELHIPAPMEEESPHADVMSHAWLDFVGECYPKFLAADDFDANATPEMELFYQRVDGPRRDLRRRVEDLELEREALEKEWAELQSTPDPLIQLQDKLQRLERDKVKFQAYLKTLSDQIATRKSSILKVLADKELALKEGQAGLAELHDTTRLVKAQGLTPIEIQHMTSERTSLNASVSAAINKQRTLLEKTFSLEIDLQKRIARAQGLTAVYDAKGQRLGILPQPPEGYEHVNFVQEVQGAAENPVPDCTTLVKPALVELRAKAKAECGRTNGEDIVLEEKITRANEAISELRESYEIDAAELEMVESENRDLKEAANAEFAIVNTELDRLQNQVNHLSSTMGQSLAAAEWRYDQRILERTTVFDETNEIRKANREALELALDEIITYRGHVMSQVDVLLALADGAEE